MWDVKIIDREETQKEIVEQQKWVIRMGMQRAAVVVEGAATKMQLKRTSETSENTNEHFFGSFEEALTFLKGN